MSGHAGADAFEPQASRRPLGQVPMKWHRLFAVMPALAAKFAQACLRGHPRLPPPYPPPQAGEGREGADVDGRDKPGHGSK
jgi:hypothetical protein